MGKFNTDEKKRLSYIALIISNILIKLSVLPSFKPTRPIKSPKTEHQSNDKSIFNKQPMHCNERFTEIV